ncbi:MAG: NHL repeat-containing protein [Chloroflexota bacterium]
MKRFLALAAVASALLGADAPGIAAQPPPAAQADPLHQAVVATGSCDSSTDYGDGNGIALDTKGNVYVALGQAPGSGPSAGGIAIQKRTAAGRLIATWMTAGATSARALHPTGIALDAHGNIYVTDSNADHIVKLSASGQVLATWGTKGTAPGQLDEPAGLAVDRRGDLYVADRGNSRIQVFDGAGQVRAVWRLPALSKEQPSLPTGIAVDGQGRIYVADDEIRILVLSPTGVVLHAWGSKGGAPDQFRHPVGLALDPHGRLDIADELNARIQQFTTTGKPITRWATGGTKIGWFGAQGSASAQPAFPTGIAITPSGVIYVLAGWCPSRIQTFPPGGRIPAGAPIVV